MPTQIKQLEELQGKLKDRQEKVAKAFDEAKVTDDDGNATYDLGKVKVFGDDLSTSAVAEKIRESNDEMNDLGQQIDSLKGAQSAGDNLNAKGSAIHEPGKGEPAQGKGGYNGPIDLGTQIVSHDRYKQWASGNKGGEFTVDWGLKEVKTLFETGAGWSPESTRIGRVVDAETRPIQVLDLVPDGQTGQASVVYMQESTRTHSATEVAEGGTYPESTFDLSEITEPVRKIGDSVPVTDEQLEDVQGAESYLNNRLRFGVRQRLDNQVLNGNGTPPNLTGILNRSGIQSQSKGSDPVPDAVHKAITQVRLTGRAQPNAVVMHHNDWQGVRLLRTSDGVYIWGSPSEQGQPRMWGLPIALSDAIAEGTALVGDFANFAQMFERRGIVISQGTVGTQFTEGKQTLRADMRVALSVYRPAAFSTVTGI